MIAHIRQDGIIDHLFCYVYLNLCFIISYLYTNSVHNCHGEAHILYNI